MRSLERDRNRRFGGASELAADLERYLQGAPVVARPPSARYRIGKFIRKHRTPVTAGVLLLMMLVAGAAVSTILALRATRAEGEMREAHEKQSQLRAEAVRGREAALASAAIARLNAYVADINVSHHALEDGHTAKALSLLESQSREPGEADLRGFEWRYLAGRCLGDPHRSLPRMDSPVQTLAFSADAELLAVGTQDELVVWDLRHDRRVSSMPGGATAVAFFPDRERVAVSTWQSVGVYELDSGDSLLEFGDYGAAMALTADGKQLAASDRRGVTVWETATWTPWRRLAGAHGPLAFSPDGKILATGSEDGIVLWPLDSEGRRVVLEESLTPLGGMFPGGRRIVFSPDGSQVIAPHIERSRRGVFSLGVWEAGTGREAGVFAGVPGDQGHSGIISALDLDREGALLATSSWDHSVRLWDLEARRLLRPLFGHRGEVWAVALSPDGSLVASGSKDGAVKIWPTEQVADEDAIEGRWRPLGFSKDGAYFGALNREGLVSIFNSRTREALRSFPLQSSQTLFRPEAVAMARDLTVLAEGRTDGKLSVRRLDQESELVLPVSEGSIDFVTLAPDAATVVTVGRQDDLAWWDLGAPGDPILRVKAMYAVFSEDGGTMVAVTRRGTAVAFDTATRKEKSRIAHGGQSFGSRAALSPDGAMVALTHGFADFENAVSLWDTATGKRLGTLTGHKQGIWSVAFSPDGRTLATSSNDGTLRLWNVASRRELLSIDEPGINLTDLRFSPDGHYLLGGPPLFVSDGELRIIRAPEIEFEDRPAELVP